LSCFVRAVDDDVTAAVPAHAGGGVDVMPGGAGDDRADGGTGRDLLNGRGGNARLSGGNDRDRDTLIDNPGTNVLTVRDADPVAPRPALNPGRNVIVDQDALDRIADVTRKL
jgi:Ca2+-binding RTX toxin-like protein